LPSASESAALTELFFLPYMSDPPPVKKQKRVAKSVDSTASYGKTVTGRLKIKGVEVASTKKKAKAEEPAPEDPKKASVTLSDRIKKKSDRYCMVTEHDDH